MRSPRLSPSTPTKTGREDGAIEAVIMAAPAMGVSLLPGTAVKLRTFLDHRRMRKRERHQRPPDFIQSTFGLLISDALEQSSKLMEQVYIDAITRPFKFMESRRDPRPDD